MRVVVVGGGGREHALGWKLAQSPVVGEVIGVPGNPGWNEVGLVWPDLDPAEPGALVRRCREQAVDLVVIGPEAPLVAGLADELRAAGVAVFGPGAAGARLEGSKAFAKDFMQRHGIPTAEWARFDAVEPALAWLRMHGAPIVVKADGLAAGKGVVVAASEAEAEAAIRDMLEGNRFGAAGRAVILEAVLAGEEVSVLALTDGESIVPLLPSQDHKRIGEDDQGPNTGGMGAYTPTTLVDEALWQRIRNEVLEPTVRGLRADGTDFRGVLYCGLMIVDGAPWVLEYNVRFGDPECQPVLMQMRSDFFPWLLATAEGRLDGQPPLEWHPGCSVCVVMASEGYPEKAGPEVPIAGLADWRDSDDVVVFQAGTALDEAEQVVTHGGRVLGVTARGADIAEARERAYAAVDRLRWPGAQVRRDIGKRELLRQGLS